MITYADFICLDQTLGSTHTAVAAKPYRTGKLPTFLHFFPIRHTIVLIANESTDNATANAHNLWKNKWFLGVFRAKSEIQSRGMTKGQYPEGFGLQGIGMKRIESQPISRVLS